MTTIIRREIRKRGFFGKIFKFLFIAFNILMALWFFGGLFSAGGQVANETDTARQVGGAIGMTLGMGLLGGIWVAGDIILGMFVLFTRGNKIIVEEAA